MVKLGQRHIEYRANVMPTPTSETNETTFHVRYAETDTMGIVHHSVYLVYFEEGRSQLFRQLGSDYAAVEASGLGLPVVEAGARYLMGVRYGQRVTIRTRVDELRSRSLTFAYEVVNPDTGDKLATGFSRHIWTDADGSPTRMPEEWQRFLEKSNGD